MSRSFPSIDKPWLSHYTDDELHYEFTRQNMYDAIRHEKEWEEQEALDFFGTKISYGKLYAEIDRAARAFAQHGVGKGDVVSLMLPTMPETIYAVYALNRLGATANMIDVRNTPKQLKACLDRVHSKLLVIMAFSLKEVDTIREELDVEKIIILRECESVAPFVTYIYKVGEWFSGRRRVAKSSDKYLFWGDFIQDEKQLGHLPADTADTHDDAMIFQTSGTTGMPKSVVHSSYNINNSAYYFRFTLHQPQPADKVLCIMPAFALFGFITNVHMALMHKMRIALIPLFEVHRFAQILHRYRPNHLFGVPSMWGSLCRVIKPDTDLSFIKSIHVAGEVLSAELQDNVNTMLKNHGSKARLCIGYGMTETGGGISALIPDRCKCHDAATGRVGIPLPYANVSIRDYDSGQELPYGEVGEICVQSPIALLRYYGNDEATRRLRHVDCDGQEWLHTGDSGRMDEDGCLYIVGRYKRMIVTHDGTKLFPIEIESVISTHADVTECVVVPMPDPQHHNCHAACALVVVREGADSQAMAETLRLLCQQKLPFHLQPSSIQLVSALPHTMTGKVDVKKAEKLLRRGS